MSNEMTLGQAASQAIMPEQLVHYVSSISDSKAKMVGPCLVYFREDVAIVVAYSLDGNPQAMTQAKLGKTMDELAKRKDLERVIVHAAFAPSMAPKWAKMGQEAFWQIGIPYRKKRKKGIMLELFGKEPAPDMPVTKETWGPEHDGLVEAFVGGSKPLNASSLTTMQNLSKYVTANQGATLFCARDKKGKLTAALVADFTSAHTAFYMISFSIPNAPREAEDSLMKALIDEATDQGKKRINIGLGNGPKTKDHKDKWGAEPFLPFVETVWELGDSGKAQALYYEREMARREQAKKNEPPLKKLIRWIGL